MVEGLPVGNALPLQLPSAGGGAINHGAGNADDRGGGGGGVESRPTSAVFKAVIGATPKAPAVTVDPNTVADKVAPAGPLTAYSVPPLTPVVYKLA